MTALVAGMAMYDWPEVRRHVDALWSRVASELRDRGIPAPDDLSRPDNMEKVWRDPAMIIGQVCAINPVRDGLGETDVLGTICYAPPPGLPDTEPGIYYSAIVARRDDPRTEAGLGAFRSATLAANGIDSQSGYWSLGHEVRTRELPFFGLATFTGAHRESVRAVAARTADVAAIDVHSWRLALEHEPAAADLAVIATTPPTPGVASVIAWELRHLKVVANDALSVAIDSLVGTPHAEALHITGYRARRMEEFEVVGAQVEAASHRRWHL